MNDDQPKAQDKDGIVVYLREQLKSTETALELVRNRNNSEIASLRQQLEEARQIAKMLWRDDIAYSASKVLEKAPWLESDEDPS